MEEVLQKNLKKFLVIALIFIFFYRVHALYVRAQEVTPTPAPTVEPTLEPSPTPTDLPESPTPEPTLDPTPTEQATILVDSTPTEEPTNADLNNGAVVTNDVTSEGNSGDNSIAISPGPTASPQPSENGQEENSCSEQPIESPTPTATPTVTVVNTGDSVAVTEVENNVNSIEIDSKVIFQTLNIFLPGDINLSINPLNVMDEVIRGDGKEDGVINVSMLDATNYAYIENNIDSNSNSGGNKIEGASDAQIVTGNAYSIVSLLNKANVTIIGSTIHIVTINIFGAVEGNIILPDFTAGSEGCCQGDLDLNNLAILENNINSQAVSGENQITTTQDSKDTEINTGDAISVVNLANIINATYLGGSFQKLYVNVLGSWWGKFIGWGQFKKAIEGTSFELTSNSGKVDQNCPECIYDTEIDNNALIVNNINSSANSGGNSINGANAQIHTGDAISSTSLVNIINSTFKDTLGFLGFINIFGTLEGDIGGLAEFKSLEVVEEEGPETLSESQPSVRENGGVLYIESSNNTGEYVYPGDTITFFIKIKNSGVGRVYDTKWGIRLINDEGIDSGGVTFDIGEIEAGKGFKISTGLALAKTTKPSRYTARAYVRGVTGPENSEVFSYSDSYFVINSKNPIVLVSLTNEDTPMEGQILGETAGSVTSYDPLVRKMWYIFFGLLGIYLPAKGYQNRRQLGEFATKTAVVASKGAVALRGMLSSLFT